MFIFILGPMRIIKLNSTKFVFKNYGVAKLIESTIFQTVFYLQEAYTIIFSGLYFLFFQMF